MSAGSIQVPSDLKCQVAAWFDNDQNENTRNEINELINSENWHELHTRLDTRISFGTAGLRARMEAGFSRMNTLTVLQASQGLATYLAEKFANNKTVVVGHDHRFHSKEFAQVTIAAFLQAGFTVYDLCAVANDGAQDVYVHTPLVPFAIDQLNAAGGVMITASHNPKLDNGYKVYYANGCQIIPPHDRLIAQSIGNNRKPWADAWNFDLIKDEAIESGRLVNAKAGMAEKYVNTVAQKLISTKIPRAKQGPWFVYTPMHGVGCEIFSKIVEQVWGLQENVDYLCVAEQKNPDPEFPTVSFPNPEEKGALTAAINLAEANNIVFVLANDPDADRFSAAVKYQNNWKQLSGNEIGFLFAQYTWDTYKKKTEELKSANTLVLINSTVSSQMIKKMAEVEGFQYRDTLTGFKWLGNEARVLEKAGLYVPFAYEEAIGYMFSDVVHDKDGVSAAIVFLQMIWAWAAQELSPIDILQDGYARYGAFQEYNGYYIVPDLAITNTVFEAIRESYRREGRQYPLRLGDEFTVETFIDLTVGYQSDTPDHVPRLPVDPSAQMITAVLRSQVRENDSVRFTTRGSGTEPKLKVYIEAISDTEASARALVKRTWDALKKYWFRPEQTGLTTSF
ncbi:LAME_0G13388g1_1 [Lachancea meyersii CBS 8951]|uniref:phosphopentomutase n=1 Tax=Lachancea meyersii CBS 8951 TaxID=1266667 RepID=A0A1G4K9Z5_9SACH|nr:LAME_0G13388g1_1 [Lachancea meyersii CBS 8951]